MYRALGLLRPDTNFTVEVAHAQLVAALAGLTVARDADQIVISQGEWWLAVALVTGEHVREETEGLLGHIAGVEQDEAATLAKSNRRVEVWTDVPDPFMEHFDDYLKVVGVLKSFDGLLAVDPKEPGLL